MIMPEDWERSISLMIADIARLQRRVFARNASDLDLTRSQWSVLISLFRHEGIKQAALASMLEIEPITLVRLLDKLEAMGLVERRFDPDDRRIKRLYLQDTAQGTLEKIWKIGEITREQALFGLSEAERDTLCSLLSRIKTNLSDDLDETCGETLSNPSKKGAQNQ